MKRLIAAIFASSAVLLAGASAQATVLTFDDLPVNEAPIPNGYGGLNWSNMYYLNTFNLATYYPTNGYTNGTVSGDYVALNAGGNMAVTSGAAPFDFTGAYFTGAWNNGLNINILGYNGVTLLYNTTVIVDTYSPTWFQFDYFGVTDLVFSSFGGVSAAGYGGYQFAMDNFTFNQQPTPTPEPGTIALVGAGILGLGYWKRRSSRARA